MNWQDETPVDYAPPFASEIDEELDILDAALDSEGIEMLKMAREVRNRGWGTIRYNDWHKR